MVWQATSTWTPDANPSSTTWATWYTLTVIPGKLLDTRFLAPGPHWLRPCPSLHLRPSWIPPHFMRQPYLGMVKPSVLWNRVSTSCCVTPVRAKCSLCHAMSHPSVLSAAYVMLCHTRPCELQFVGNAPHIQSTPIPLQSSTALTLYASTRLKLGTITLRMYTMACVVDSRAAHSAEHTRKYVVIACTW